MHGHLPQKSQFSRWWMMIIPFSFSSRLHHRLVFFLYSHMFLASQFSDPEISQPIFSDPFSPTHTAHNSSLVNNWIVTYQNWFHHQRRWCRRRAEKRMKSESFKDLPDHIESCWNFAVRMTFRLDILPQKWNGSSFTMLWEDEVDQELRGSFS